MIHPLTFGITLLDLLALGLLLAGARRAEQVLRGWSPEDAGAEQLALERGLEAASLFGRGAAALLGLSTLLFVLAVAAALLSALQTFLGYGDLASRTRATAAEYGSIRREIDQMLATGGEFDADAVSVLRQRMDTLAREAPVIPDRIWDYAINKMAVDGD